MSDCRRVEVETSVTCAECAYLEGAAVAFGIIGMAEAINARRLRRACDYCYGVGEARRGLVEWESTCPECNGHGATWARPEVQR